MDYFKKYWSNTIGGSANQKYFSTDGETVTGRVFYRVTAGGRYNYSFLFTNMIDSTYADGSESHADLVCDQWELIGIKAAVCTPREFARQGGGGNYDFKPLTFDGALSKTVMPGEFFYTDEVALAPEAEDYIVLELTVKGDMLPYHEENILRIYRKEAEGFVLNNRLPIPAMVGCDRPVKYRLGYLGDSITQGIGVPWNSYTHWNAVTTRLLGEDCGCWNLGIGFARAEDAARDGAWLFKAKQCQGVTLCLGVNDVSQGCHTAEQMMQDLERIVDVLQGNGVRVLIQTLPPFDFKGEALQRWVAVNAYIRNTLSQKADGFFDCVPILSEGAEHPEKAAYGGHPNTKGCAAWGKALYPHLLQLTGLSATVIEEIPAALAALNKERAASALTILGRCGDKTVQSTERGVAPLLKMIENGETLQGFLVADKAVGRGAAFLYILLGAKAVFAPVMSVEAKRLLTANGIGAYTDLAVSAMVNRDCSDFCPMEQAVAVTDDPAEALRLMREKKKIMEAKRNG